MTDDRRNALTECLAIADGVKASCEILTRKGIGDPVYARAGEEWAEEIASHIRKLLRDG